jgi:hypothetical protein
VKRFAVGIGGFLYGLFITWLCLVELSRLDWFRDPHRITHGCTELGHCPFPWYNWPIVFAFILGPATVSAALNTYAWHRWSLKHWTCYAASMTGLVVALYFGSAFFIR